MATDLCFEVITDLEKAKQIWYEISPHRSLDDEWDFRYVFIKGLNYGIHFIVGYDDDKLVGLLPLQHNNLNGLMPPYYPKNNRTFYEFFGGDDTDDNVIMLKPGYEDCLKQFLDKLPNPTYLAPLLNQIQYKTDKAEFYVNKYIEDISSYKSYEDFIDAHFLQESRGKFKRGVRNVFRDYQIEVLENNFEDLDLLFKLNIERFGEGSSFNLAYRQEVFKELMKHYQVEMITLVVNGKKEGVSFAIVYKGVYSSMNIGVNQEINNLGKLLIMLGINKAIEKGCKVYDAGKGDSGWKEVYRLSKIPQYKLLPNP